MIFSPEENEFLLSGLAISGEETSINSQGGQIVLLLQGETARKFSKKRAEQEGRPKAAGQIEFEAAAAFLKGEQARTFALNHARKSTENPIVLATGTSHPTMIPGEKPNEPSAYRMVIPIGRKPFA